MTSGRIISSRCSEIFNLFKEEKFAGFGAVPHFNARPSGLADVLQNSEALLLNFGQSQYFPNVGKYCTLSSRAPPSRARGFSIEISFFCGFAEVILRPYRVFVDIHVILYLQIGTSLPPSLRKPEGGVQSARTSLFGFLNTVF